MFVINIKKYRTFSFTVFDNTFSFRKFWSPYIESKSIFTITGPIHLLQYGTVITSKVLTQETYASKQSDRGGEEVEMFSSVLIEIVEAAL